MCIQIKMKLTEDHIYVRIWVAIVYTVFNSRLGKKSWCSQSSKFFVSNQSSLFAQDDWLSNKSNCVMCKLKIVMWLIVLIQLKCPFWGAVTWFFNVRFILSYNWMNLIPFEWMSLLLCKNYYYGLFSAAGLV